MPIDQKLRVLIDGNTTGLNKALTTASTRLNQFGTRLQSIGTSLSTRLTLPIALAGAAAVKSASDFEKLKTQLNVLTGSAKEGARVFERLVKFSASTPFQLDQLAKANNTLMGFGVSADDAFKHLQMIGDIAAVSGGDLQGISVAFGQVAAAGRLMGQDLLQLINNGVPIIDMLSKSMGVAKSEIKDMVSQGKVTFPVLIKAFQQATSEGGKFNNGMKVLSKTFAGQFSTLKDNLNIALAEFGKLLIPTLNDLMAFLTKTFRAINNLDHATKQYILRIAGLAAGIPIVITALGGIGVALGALLSPFGLITVAIAGFLYFFDDIHNAFVNFETSAKTFILNTIVKIIREFDQFMSTLKFAAKMVGEFFEEGFSGNFSEIWEQGVKERANIGKKAGEEIAKNLTNGFNAGLLRHKTGTIKKVFNNLLNQLPSFSAQDTTSTSAETKQDFSGFKAIFADDTNNKLVTTATLLKTVTDQTERFNEIEKQRNDIMEQRTNLNLERGQILTDLLTQSFQNLSSGGNFFEPIIQYLKQLVIRLVAAAAAAAILNSMMGGMGVAGKGGLEMGSGKGFGSLFKSFSGLPFANGGIVSAPTMGLMGEYSGVRSNPEVVAPLDKLKTMIGTTGSQNVQVGGEFKIKGQDLVVAVQRATNQRNRIK